jgi:hypothetical protein
MRIPRECHTERSALFVLRMGLRSEGSQPISMLTENFLTEVTNAGHSFGIKGREICFYGS